MSHTKGRFPQWRLNSTTKQVEILLGSRVLEVTILAQTPARLSFHRAELAKANGVTFVEVRPRRRAT